MHLPHYILEKYEKGIIDNAHFSDILRTSLFVEYGGVWIDSTVYCTGKYAPFFDYPLFVYQNWKFDIQQSMIASNWLISAKKKNPILKAVLDLLYDYWQENDSVSNYFLYHFFFKMAADFFEEQWKAVPRYSNIPPHILQFELFNKYDDARFQQIKQMSNFHKLSWKYDLENKDLAGTYYEKIVQELEIAG